ncbi:MAG: phosphodiesterase [Spirochaetales bacterium]|nr:phosphodiesterase [Spirochaetales bacterium]
MKIMILSDIHGKADSLERALTLYEKGGFERLFLLGDLMYHGPRNPLPEGYEPPRVAELLNPYKEKITAVRGNCESEVDQMLIHFPLMADFALFHEGNSCYHLSHGHLGTERIGEPRTGEIRLSGHTHIPLWEEREGVFYGNPGSLSLPKGGFVPSYGVLEEGRFSVLSLEDQKEILGGFYS